MEGIAFGEQPRWHEGRLWFSDWGPPEVIAVDVAGNHEVILPAPSFPCCVDWLPDGRLLLVSAREGRLLRQEPGGSLVTHGDLSGLSKPAAGNELVVDGRGNAYVNGGGFDLMAGEPFAPGIVALVTPRGTARVVAGADGTRGRHPVPGRQSGRPGCRPARWRKRGPVPAGSLGQDAAGHRADGGTSGAGKAERATGNPA